MSCWCGRLGLAALTVLVSACASGTGMTARPAPFPGAPLPPPGPPVPAAIGLPSGARAPVASAVLETALGLRGIPYQFGGTAPETGFDCSGLVRYVFQQHAVLLPRTVIEQFQVGREVEMTAVHPGDLLFFSTVAPGPSHVGIALNPETFLHAPGSGAVVRLERIDAPYWRSRFIGARRLLALTID